MTVFRLFQKSQQVNRPTKPKGKVMSRRVTIFLLACSGLMSFLMNEANAQATDSSWTAPIKIQIRSQEYPLSLGARPGAKAGFDNGVDAIAPPPPFTPYAVFAISEFPNFLKGDFRGPSGKMVWSLRILNTNGDTSRVSWNLQELPQWRTATIGNSVDMKKQNTAIFVGDQSLDIVADIASTPPPPPPKKGCCDQSAASVAGLDPSTQWKVEGAFNVAFFLLPILLLRRRKR